MNGLRKKDFIYEELLRRLMTARYRFGEPILVKELSEETGVSRQPIMAALIALSAEGFVSILPQIGCQVASPTPDDIGDFFLMFERMEGLMAELAATRHSSYELGSLVDLNKRIAGIDLDAAQAPEQYRLLNRELHSTIHEMARSPMLQSRQRNLFAMTDFYIEQTVGFRPHIRDAVAEHEEVIAAIGARDPALARDTTERHIRAVATVVLEGVKKSR